MEALVCREPGQLALEQRSEPERKDNEVLVRVRRIGVCGTDYHIYQGNQPFLQYPRIMGHELAVEIVEAPAGGAFKSGDLAIVNPYLSCGSCHACQKGKPNCCMRIAATLIIKFQSRTPQPRPRKQTQRVEFYRARLTHLNGFFGLGQPHPALVVRPALT